MPAFNLWLKDDLFVRVLGFEKEEAARRKLEGRSAVFAALIQMGLAWWLQQRAEQAEARKHSTVGAAAEVARA